MLGKNLGNRGQVEKKLGSLEVKKFGKIHTRSFFNLFPFKSFSFLTKKLSFQTSKLLNFQSPSLSPKRSSSKAFGFTLAEVAITLGIIGLVAAFTIPSLLKKTDEQSLLAGFQTNYSSLSQAYVRAVQENGTADTWPTAKDAYNYFKPYLNIQKDCGFGTECYLLNVYTDITGSKTPYQMSGIKIPYQIILANGATLWFNKDTYLSIFL